MTYTSEFIIPNENLELFRGDVDEIINMYKERSAFSIGTLIEQKVDHEELISENDDRRFRLQVQAFSQKDWVAFKEEIVAHIKNNFPLGRAQFELIQIGTMFARLESIGTESHEEQSKKAR